MKFLLAIALLLAATVVLAYAQTDEDAEWEKYKVVPILLSLYLNSKFVVSKPFLKRIVFKMY
jgi:hypothetical protein